MSDPITIKVFPADEHIRINILPPPRITIKSFPVGQQGPPGISLPWTIDEVPTGVIDGVNTEFEALNDFVPETVQVVLNGQVLTSPDDFHTTGVRNVFIDRPQPPIVGDKVRLNYQQEI